MIFRLDLPVFPMARRRGGRGRPHQRLCGGDALHAADAGGFALQGLAFHGFSWGNHREIGEFSWENYDKHGRFWVGKYMGKDGINDGKWSYFGWILCISSITVTSPLYPIIAHHIYMTLLLFNVAMEKSPCIDYLFLFMIYLWKMEISN